MKLLYTIFLFSLLNLLFETFANTEDKCPPVLCKAECKTVLVDGCKKCECIKDDPCARIRCRSGYVCVTKEVQCIRTPCPPIGQCIPINSTCSCFGDPHCYTFDGAGMWDYQGTCEYILTKSLPQFQPTFTVSSKNTHLNGNNLVSYVEYVNVEIFNDNIHMQTAAPYSLSIVVKVNNVLVSLPYLAANYRIDVFVNFARVSTNFGLTVEYSNYFSVNVIVSASLQNLVEGYCGNFNGDANDDATDRQGNILPNIGRDTGAALGSSWVIKKSDSCVSLPEIKVIARECPASRKRCEQINNPNGIFRKCIELLPSGQADKYFDSCVFDAGVTCADEVVCATIQGFVQHCRSVGVVVGWREATNCPCKCNDEYAECPLTEVKACPATCADPMQTRPCNETALRDVCVCKSGYVLKDGKCTAIANCGCVDNNGGLRKAGETWMGPGCNIQYTCGSGGVVSSQSSSCPSRTICNIATCIDPCILVKCGVNEVCKIQCFNPTCKPPRTTCQRN